MKIREIFFLLFSGSVIACFQFSVEAAQVNLTTGATYGTPEGPVSVSGSLNGDFSGNVLTLNSSAPLSTLSVDLSRIDTSSFYPGAHQTFDFSCGAACANLLLNNLNDVSIQVDINTIAAPPITKIPAWNFNLGGRIDFNSLTGSLMGVPQPASATMFTTSETFTPELTAVINPGVNPHNPLAILERNALGAALDAVPRPMVTLTATGTWTSDTVTLLDAALRTNGPDLQINADTQNVLAGSWNLTPTFDFGRSHLSALESDIANAIYNQEYSNIQSLVDGSIARMSGPPIGGITQTCSASGQSFTCTDKLSFSATIPQGVPEPSTLSLLGAGLLFMLGAASGRFRSTILLVCEWLCGSACPA